VGKWPTCSYCGHSLQFHKFNEYELKPECSKCLEDARHAFNKSPFRIPKSTKENEARWRHSHSVAAERRRNGE
jgi:hypothetical protein